MITMTLGGLWHGASWTFVVWGILHGALLIVHREFRDLVTCRPRLNRSLQSLPGTALRIALTFLTVCVCWVFFRATTFSAAATILGRMAIPHSGLGSPLDTASFWFIAAVVVLSHAAAHRGFWRWAENKLPAPVIGAGYATAVTVALMLALDSGKAFIYFQF